MPYDFEILCEISIGLVDAYEHEQYILEKYKEFKYVPKIYFAGKEEVLSINPLEYDERLKELYLYQKELLNLPTLAISNLPNSAYKK